MRFRVTWKGTTASTNDDVWALARAGEPAGACVASFAQESGRGTWKRVWESPRGGLYFSFLLRPRTPQAVWPESSILLARTCAQVIRDFCGVGDGIVRVKPKNDVVCDAGKLAGISLEARDGCLNVGCGTNVFKPEGGIRTDGRNVPAYLEDLCVQGARGTLGPFSEETIEGLLDAYLSAIGRLIDVRSDVF